MTFSQVLSGTTVLVTGAGGFLGQHIVPALAETGARVRVITGPIGCDLPIPCGVDSVVELDIRNESALVDLLAGCRIVVHLAGPPSVLRSFDVPASYVDTHVVGTTSLLKALDRADHCRLVYISSAEVYGRPLYDYVSEDHRLEARSPYAACKIAAEYMIAAFAHANGQDAVIFRPFSIYGPGASPDSLICSVIRMAKAGEPIILSDLRPVRDYCYVTDVAQAVVQACSLNGQAGIRTFNIGTMEGTSVADVARMIAQGLQVDLPVLERAGCRRPGDSEIYRLIADNSRAVAGLSWVPQVSLAEGLLRVLAD